VEDFYKKVLDFVEKVKAGGRKEEKARAEEAQQRIMSGSTLDRAELVSELSVLFHYVGIMLYLRGYQDAEHHRRAINPVHRTPGHHEDFHDAVTTMLDENPEMEVEKVCAELERRKVAGAFDIDGRSEDFGTNGVAWTEKPTPRSIRMAIKRIRTDVKRKSRASQRQLSLGLPKRKG
jgi:phosphoribosyl-ATP pyrophosphohydrolase